MPSLVEIDPVVLEKKMEMLKVYDNANNNYDNGQSSLEPSAQVRYKGTITTFHFTLLCLFRVVMPFQEALEGLSLSVSIRILITISYCIHRNRK